MLEIPLRDLALAELTRRRAQARSAVGARQMTVPRADALTRCYAALVLFFHGDLPAECLPERFLSEPEPIWLDAFPFATPAHTAMAEIEAELRRAATNALAAANARPEPDEPQLARARGLLRLHEAVRIHAGKPPLDLSARKQEAAA